jgi:hypothetical protein
VAGLAIAVSLLAVHPAASSAPAPTDSARTTPSGDFVVWAVGDVCDNADRATDCSDVAARIKADPQRDAVLVLGDAQYDSGTLAEYQRYWAPKMGSLDPIARPVPGNHEYRTAGAAGYFDYWGTRAGPRGKGWYAFTLGAWRIVAANSNCGRIGGCGAASAVGRFVVDQLKTAGSCELVFAHHPVFSDGSHGDTPEGRALFQHAYNHRAELYLAGHDHNYQRFGLKRPDGVNDSAGVRSVVVGTGGAELTPFRTTPKRTQVRQHTAFGALRLVLGRSGYTATFVGIGGATLDTFSGSCR